MAENNVKRANTAVRLKEIMEMRGIKQVDLVKMCQPYCNKYGIHIGKSTISQYVSGKSEPSQHKLFILGSALNVSEAWLMGYDVPMERKTSPASLLEDGKVKILVDLFVQLTDAQQDMIISSIKGILSEK